MYLLYIYAICYIYVFIYNIVLYIYIYADKTYDKSLNVSFKRKIEIVQYNAAITIPSAIKGTPSDKLYQEIDCIKSHCQIRISLIKYRLHKIILELLASYFQEYLNSYSNDRSYSA